MTDDTRDLSEYPGVGTYRYMTDLGAILFLVIATAVLGLLFVLLQGRDRGRDDVEPTSGTPFDPPPPPG